MPLKPWRSSPPVESHAGAIGSPVRGVWQLVLLSVVVSVMWLVVFPAATRLPFVAERMRENERRKIDPSAMFYTELEAMPEIERSIHQRTSGTPDSIWHWPR